MWYILTRTKEKNMSNSVQKNSIEPQYLKYVNSMLKEDVKYVEELEEEIKELKSEIDYWESESKRS